MTPRPLVGTPEDVTAMMLVKGCGCGDDSPLSSAHNGIEYGGCDDCLWILMHWWADRVARNNKTEVSR